MIKSIDAPYRPVSLGGAVLRDVATLCVAAGAYGLAFGVLGRAVGLAPALVIAISVLVYAGGSQMALLGVLSAGGAPLAGVASGLVINSRFVAFGAVVAPLMQGGRGRRLLAAYLLTDEVATMATAQPDHRSQQQMFWVTGVALWTTWQLSTALGVALGQVLGDPAAVGLDAAFPAAFMVLLVPLLRGRAERVAAVGGGVGAVIGLQVLPAGLPVLLAMATGLLAAIAVTRNGRLCDDGEGPVARHPGPGTHASGGPQGASAVAAEARTKGRRS